MSHLSQQKFTLLQRLSISSLAAMLVTAILMVLLYRQDQLIQFQRYASEENERTLYHLIYTRGDEINAFIKNTEKTDSKSLRVSQDLDSSFSSALDQINKRNFLKLKIFNLSGVAIYSSIKSEIGGAGSRPDLLAIALQGKTVHVIEHRDTFLSNTGEMHDANIFETYMPLISSGKIIGIIESYDDAAPMFEQLKTKTIWISLIVLGAFSSLYAALFFILSRTDRAIAEWQKLTNKRENSLREAQSIASMGSYVLNIRNGLWEGSEMLNQIFGIDSTYEHSLEGWQALIHPDDCTAMIDYLRNEVIAQGKDFNKEYRIIRHNDQAERWMHELGKLEFDAQGQPLELHGTIQDISTRKQAELTLQQSEEKFRVLMQSATDAIFIADAKKGLLIDANKSAEKLIGRQRAEIIGMHQSLLHPEAEAENYAKLFRRHVESGGGLVAQPVYVQHRDGRKIPVEISSGFVEVGGKQILQGVFRDITERRQMEIALAEEHNLLQTIINTAPMRIFWKDRELCYLGCNPAFAKDAGETSPQDVIGKNDYQLGWKNQADIYRADDRLVIDSDIPKLFYDEPQTTPDGKMIWLQTSKVPLHNLVNETIGVLGIYQDITERKRAEKNIQLLAKVFESASEAILISDANNIILAVNDAFTRITGYTREEVVGKNPEIMGSGTNSMELYANLWKSVHATGHWHGEIVDRRKSGEIYPKNLSVNKL